jgi:hypothetical protein
MLIKSLGGQMLQIRILRPVLRIQDVYPGSEFFFILDPNFFSSWIQKNKRGKNNKFVEFFLLMKP